jgi:hypothetical protein
MKQVIEERPASALGVRATLSLENQRLYYLAVLLSIVPLWFGRYLPMVDMPGHAAIVTALQQLFLGDSRFTEAFEANLFIPYLFGYALLYAVALLLPITVATKLVVSVAILFVPLLTGALLREIGADERWKWLAIPGSYSLAFYWGFLSYIVAFPIALLLLIQTIRFDRSATLANGLLVAALAVFLFFSHVIVMGFACMTAVVYLAGSRYKDLKGLLLRVLPYTAPLPLVVFWLVTRLATETSIQNAPVVYGPISQRLLSFVVQPSGLDGLSLLGLGVTATIAFLPRLAGARFAASPARWLPFVVATLVFLAVPAYAFQTGFLYERFGIFLVPLWLVAWNAPEHPVRKLDWLAMSVILLWIFANVGRFAAFARETQHFDEILAAMEPGRKVASLVVENATPLFATPVYLHFPSWYQASKFGIVDFNFADFRMVVRYKHPQHPRITEGLVRDPTQFDWVLHGGADYDYYVVKSDGDVAAAIFKDHLPSVELIAHSGWWWLYRNRASSDGIVPQMR